MYLGCYKDHDSNWLALEEGKGRPVILRLLFFALTVLSLAACATTTIDSLTPGTPLGTTERGFMKTTTGLSLTVRGRSYDQVWAAADSAMAQAVTAEAGTFSETLALIDDDKARGVIRAAIRNPLGATRAYVAIFVSPVTPTAAAYVVSVSQKLKSEAEVVKAYGVRAARPALGVPALWLGRKFRGNRLRSVQTGTSAMTTARGVVRPVPVVRFDYGGFTLAAYGPKRPFWLRSGPGDGIALLAEPSGLTLSRDGVLMVFESKTRDFGIRVARALELASALRPLPAE